MERLSGAGFAVAFTYHNSERDADEVARLFDATAIRADLSDSAAACAAIHTQFAAAFNQLDVLVNNASAYQPADLRHTDVELTRRLMAVHFESPLLLCKHFESMLRRSHGHIVNMVDLLAEKPWPQYLAYCASKAALWNLTLGLAKDLAPQITVNGIAPGVVEWPMDYPQTEKEKYLQRVPLGRAGTPQEVADLVYFLVTGGSYITGQIIRLDGGRSIT